MTGDGASRPADGVVGALLLASGIGRRFDSGGRRNKLLARLPDGQTLVAASARALLGAVDHVAVVVPARGSLLEAALSDLPVRIVRNGRAKEGIGASIAVGVAALRAELPGARGWLVALGDMPFIHSDTIRRLAGALAGAALDDAGDDAPAPIVAPAFGHVRGHPVGFPRCYDDELAALGGDTGAQVLLHRHPVRLVACDDPGVLRDIDTKDDLTRLVTAGATARSDG